MNFIHCSICKIYEYTNTWEEASLKAKEHDKVFNHKPYTCDIGWEKENSKNFYIKYHPNYYEIQNNVQDNP